MNNKIYKYILLSFFFLNSLVYAHKEWVHQHQVRQAYLLLKQQLGFDVAILQNHLGFNHNGEGPGPFLGCSIVQGAWEEDLYDPVWEVGGLMLGPWSYCGWDASTTHFWNADAGDNSTINIPSDLNDCPLPGGEIPNAYWKAMHYIYGGWVIKWKPQNGYTFTASNGHTYRFEKQVLEYPMVVTFYYNSLVDLYKNGNIVFVQNPKSNFRIYNVTLRKYVSISGNFPIPAGMRNLFVWEILGRTAHLLGDMSVPAHVKNDVHPCHVQIPLNSNGTIYNEGDTYELHIGGLVGGSNPNCNDPQSIFPAQNVTWADALNQGGFINVFGKENPIRYLFYTTNQLADHFGSLSTKENPSFDPQRWYPGDNNYSVQFGNDYYSEFQQLINTMGSPVTNISDFPPSIDATTNTAFVYGIRAISGLFHWFAKECDILYAPVVAPIIANFTQSPNPLYRGNSGSVTCNLSQGNGNLNFNWSIVSGNTGFSISNENSQSVSIHYSNTDAIEKTITENISFPKETPIEGPTGAVLKCKVWNIAGSDSANVFINLATTPHGCPFVYTWNGEIWVEDNNILPQSQDSMILGQDVTDYYQLYTKPILDDGKYYLAIGEFEEEISYLDQLKLLVVDHPQETFITVDDEGEIIQFAKPAYFANAQLDSIDVYKKLVGLDSIKVEVSRDETLSLSFEDVSVGTEKWLLLIGQQQPIYKDKISGSILRRDGFTIGGGRENTTTFSSFRLRKNPTYQWVLVPDGNSSSLQVNISFKNEAEIDYTELSHKLELPFTVYTPQLLYAEHSVFGDVTSLLNQIDGQYSILNTDEMITLEYSAPPINEGMERTFIFVSRGRYVREDGFAKRLENNMLAKGKSQTENKNQNLSSTENPSIVYEYGLSQNYPNPFNPVTTISYQIKEQGLVQLKVYNLLGQEIVTLVNEVQSPGIYESLFDARNLPSGVYIYSLRVNDFVKNNKMTLLK